MLDDVESEVVGPAKPPNGQSQQKRHLERRSLGKQRGCRRHTQRQKQTAFQADHRVILYVLHNFDQRRDQRSRSARLHWREGGPKQGPEASNEGERELSVNPNTRALRSV